jgi:hypothetical protein
MANEICVYAIFSNSREIEMWKGKLLWETLIALKVIHLEENNKEIIVLLSQRCIYAILVCIICSFKI